MRLLLQKRTLAARSLPVVLLVASLSMGILACGGSSRRSAGSANDGVSAIATTVANPPAPRTDIDGDIDSAGEYHRGSRYDEDDGQILHYGRPATPADVRAVAGVVKRYYLAAGADQGSAACALLYSPVGESVPEDYGQPPGPPALRGKTCAVVMTKLFAQHHQELVADAATVKVTGVRVRRNAGQALLSFATGPTRYITIHREHGTWKIGTLRDIGLP